MMTSTGASQASIPRSMNILCEPAVATFFFLAPETCSGQQDNKNLSLCWFRVLFLCPWVRKFSGSLTREGEKETCATSLIRDEKLVALSRLNVEAVSQISRSAAPRLRQNSFSCYRTLRPRNCQSFTDNN